MCGIGGYLGAFPRELLDRMNAAQAYRGPDDGGTYYASLDGSARAIGLAHRRLSIIDLSSGGHQPMWNERGDIALIYNGELYNFRELRGELEAKGFRFKSGSDTEVLLALYEAVGPSLLERLDGIFAFAIWDARDKSLFIARDQFGVKPLYWAQSDRGFLFASEIKAINEWEGLDRTIDATALQHYLTYLYCPSPRTPFLHVRKLEPAKAMIVRDGKIARHWRYYSLPFDQPVEPISVDRAKTQLRDMLSATVRKQMVSDVPVGAFLSGGLDSSSIVAFARSQAMGRLQCFTIEADPARMKSDGNVDDLPYAREMAKHLDVDLHVISVDTDAVRHFDEMVWHLDEPQGDPAPLNVYFIAKLARENGMRVLLSGSGGDDIFSGYRRHAALEYERYWSWMPSAARSAIARGAEGLPAGLPLARRIRKACSVMPLDADERLTRYYCWINPQTAAGLAGRTYRAEDDPMIAALHEIDADTPRLNKMLYLESRFFLADHNLNYTDKMAMAASVEVRVPFLDKELVSFAARLPMNLKQRGSTGKWIFREAMRGILPDHLIDRPKTGFGAPVRSWLQNELSPMLDDLTSAGSALEGHIDLKALRALVEADRAGRIDAAYPLLGALAIGSWIRQFSPTKLRVAA